MECLKCNANISELVNFNTIGDTIICPKCGNKMIVEYDESWDDEEERNYFWVEQVKEDNE